MQTFLPYPNFRRSALVLDDRRLGQQRVEVLALLTSIKNGGGWNHHPAAKMWMGYGNALIRYGLEICREWERRGFIDHCAFKMRKFRGIWLNEGDPEWLGNDLVHLSHRSNLIRKAPDHYIPRFGEDVPDNLPYIWPI